MDARTPRQAPPARPGPIAGLVMIVGLIAIGRASAGRAEFASEEPARIEAAAFGSPSFSGDGGSSGRTSRRLAVESIPLERMSESSRRVAETAVRSATLFRRLPVETVACDHDLLEFILTKPETLVDVWRVLGISRLALDPAGPGQWRLSDGYGTVGTLRLLYRDHHERGATLVFHGRGTYTGPLAPRQLTGSCLVVVHHAADAPSPRGTPRQAVQVDAFLDVEGVGLELVTRTLQPLIVRSAAANLHEICLFVSQFHAAATRNPAGVARLAERMPRTDPEDRRRLVALACGSGAESTAAPRAGETVQAELAARWMSMEQLDAARR